jgi:formate hydrogenlyase subunit 3/multisubunit Na+/H+ antiporter MnhD subunit
MIALLFVIGLIFLCIGIGLPLVTIQRDSRYLRTLSACCTVMASVLLSIAAAALIFMGGSAAFTLWQIAPGITLSFALDRLSSVFILIIALVSGCVAIYSTEYVEHLEGGSRRNLLCGCTNLFILAMVLVVASAGTLPFLLFWELMAGASFFLVMYDYTTPEVRKAGIFYLVMTQFSTLFILAGVIALFAITGSFEFSRMGGAAGMAGTMVFVFLFLGFSIKAGIVPFHKWLPYAHPASPSPISALMSGVMLKIAIYGLIRFLIAVFTPDLLQGLLILAAGIASAVLGIIYALKERDLKGMLAFSSIENIGIIFTGIGLYVIFQATGHDVLAVISLAAALFHSLNHALIKSLLFLTSGSVIHASHTRDIERMGGLSHRMPYTSALFFCGALAISALPPLNGFASELLIYIAFFSSIGALDPLLKILLILGLALFALASALCAACFVKTFGSVFLAQPRSEECQSAREVPGAMIAGPALLASGCVILGLLPLQFLELAGYPIPLFPNMLLIGILLLAMYGFSWMILRAVSHEPIRICPTWGCGYVTQRPAFEYTGEGFSEPVARIFSSIYRTQVQNEGTFADQKNCLFLEGRGGLHLMKIFEEYLYLPIAGFTYRTASLVSRFQNGCLDTYLLYVFCTVLGLILFLGVIA